MEKQREPSGVNRPAAKDRSFTRDITRAIKICDNFLGLWLGQCNGFFICVSSIIFCSRHYFTRKYIDLFRSKVTSKLIRIKLLGASKKSTIKEDCNLIKLSA